MKIHLWKALLLPLCAALCQQGAKAQCTPAATNINTDNTVVNTYYSGTTANVPVGGRIISLAAAQGAVTAISKGDLLLIIQMQGADINRNNGLDYGDGVAGGNASGFTAATAGTYEYIVAANNVPIGGGVLYLTRGTRFSYADAAASALAGASRYQVIRVPRYASLSFSNNREITATAWNGTTGGVIAFEVTGNMALNAGDVCIDANAKGFRGGGGRQLGGTVGFLTTDVRTASTSNASKGEGIAGTPRYVRTAGTSTLVDANAETYPDGSNGNGAPGNAGGGGTDARPANNGDENTGGGGGGNGGAGGRGGKSWNSNVNIGGYGGVAPAFLSTGRLIMGGGGGAGTSNDGSGAAPAGISSSGGAGGGIIIIKAGSVSTSGGGGNSIIRSNGENGASPGNDGAGGGGAGGTIYISATNTAGLAGVTFTANGGNGGNANAAAADAGVPDDGNPEHGPGGGGGGGVIYSNGTIAAASVANNGTNGTTLTNTQAFGATPGTIGVKNQSAAAIGTLFNTICSTDVDDDDDGITDANELPGGTDPFADADADGIPNAYDATPGGSVPAFADANSDGLSDVFDNDRDGVINNDDLDSDNDGIPDIAEAGGVDTNGDGKADNLADSDGDGLVNAYDASTGGVNIANLDTDGDGIKNAYDLDSDNDGVPDAVESGAADSNNDGQIDAFADTDADGFANSVDGDADGNGTAENTAGALLVTGADGNADGRPDTYPRANTDKLGLPNAYDLDSDGDGIPDAREAGLPDSDNNGVVDGSLGADGWSDTVDALPALNAPNTDGLGPANFLDIDSDDDGLTDNVEGQTTAGYQLPSGNDADADGIDDVYDNNDGAFAGAANNGITPYNHDGSDEPDYTDTDSDNDGAIDLREGSGNPTATLTNTADTDGDGLVDQFDTFNLNTQTLNLQNNVTLSGMGNGGSASGPSPAGSNILANQTNGGSPNRDWRNNLFVLPVRLAAFTVSKNNGLAQLRWTSTDEVNFKGFMLQRSTDGNQFTDVAFVAAKGQVVNEYAYNDALTGTNAGKLYYRLKQVDLDETFVYSAVISINFDGVAKLAVTVLQNPVRSFINLRIESPRNAMALISLTDAGGRMILQKSIAVVNGSNFLPLVSTRGLSNSVYILSVRTADASVSQRLLVQQ